MRISPYFFPAAAICAALGGTVQVWGQSVLWPRAVYGAIFGIAFVFIFIFLVNVSRFSARIFKIAFLILCLWLGFSATGWRAAHLATQSLPADWAGRLAHITGTIEQLPARTNSGGTRWILAVESAVLTKDSNTFQEDSDIANFPQKIAFTSAQPLPIAPGQRWRFIARLRALSTTANARGSDTALWWWTQGVRAAASVAPSPDAAQFLGSTPWAPLQSWRHAVREKMHAEFGEKIIFNQNINQDAAGIITALVTGDQAAMSAQQWQLWRTTGVVHLVSISGLHITMFAWAAMALVRLLWARSAAAVRRAPARLVGLWAGLALAALYAAFSGWGLPAQRTLAMLAAAVLLRTRATRAPWPLVWGSVLAAVLLWQPWALMQPGLWLSFVAVAILFGLEKSPENPKNPQNRLWRWFKELGKTQIILTITLMPIMAYAFGQISLVGIIVNLFAVPWITLLVTPLALLGMIFSPLWQIAALMLEPLLAILEYFAQFSHAVIYFADIPRAVAAFSALGLLWLMLPTPPALRWLAAPLVFSALAWQPARPAKGQFAVHVFDVGQGAAALVRTASHTLLFDAGPRWGERVDAGESIVAPNARALGVGRLDALVLSHGDADHAGGAHSVLATLPTKMIFAGAGVKNIFKSNAKDFHPSKIQNCQQGISWIWDNVHFEFIYPKTQNTHFKNNNAGSCVLRIQSLDHRVAIFSGDIGAREEWEIIQNHQNQETTPNHFKDNLKTDFLLAPHHGSAGSSSRVWVQATRPGVVVFQTGFGNRWGHPAAVVRERYRATGAVLADTAHCGALDWASDAPDGNALSCLRARHRYWDAPEWTGPAGPTP